MISYGIKVKGTPEDIRNLESIKPWWGFDEDGKMNCPEEYEMGVDDIFEIAKTMVSKAKTTEFLIRGCEQDDRCGEIIKFEASYGAGKLVLKSTGWLYPEEEDMMLFDCDCCDEDGEPIEDYEPFDWLDDDVYSEVEWDDERIIDLSNDEAKETFFVFTLTNVSEFEDFGSLLMVQLPLEIGFNEINADFHGAGEIKIGARRFGAQKKDFDSLAEALSLLMPKSRMEGQAVIKISESSASMYQYLYIDGKLSCKKAVGREGDEIIYEDIDMELMSDEEKACFVTDL